jgi:cytochrome P450
VLRTRSNANTWPGEDVYLLTAKRDIEEALSEGSVQPYAQLDSGGKFMLGLDKGCAHTRQRHVVKQALDLGDDVIGRCVREALERAMVLPGRLEQFDLVQDVARQAAVRLICLLFGLPAKSHVQLELAMDATYRRLTFQIIGRHFAPDDGLPSQDSEGSRKLRDKLETQVRRAAEGRDVPEWWDANVAPGTTVCQSLGRSYGATSEMSRVVALGLMAGTVGNMKAAVTNSIDYFFRTGNDKDGWAIDRAARAARTDDTGTLRQMIAEALAKRPPAPFLARTARKGMKVTGAGGQRLEVPVGSHLVLALGAQTPSHPDLVFGSLPGGDPPHSCVGIHLAQPLIFETVRQVLRLPGLARVIEPGTHRPEPLKKDWGAICKPYLLRYQRDRRMNQQPLFLVLPIKEPIGVNAKKLEELTRAGAAVIERALNDSKNVHFAWFGIVENGTHLAMYTVYDGDFDAYVEHFALQVPLFDEQFKFLEKAPRTPVKDYPREFVQFIKDHTRVPAAGYFYSAYPGLGVAEIHNRGLDRR